jgi:hypothetical protein
MEWLLVILLLVFVFLATQRWFWILALFLAGLAALFAMIASIIHFQILWAIGFFILMTLCWGILELVAQG